MADQVRRRRKFSKIHSLILRAGFYNVKDFINELQLTESMVYQTLSGKAKISRYQAAFWAFYLKVHPSELAGITEGDWDFTVDHDYATWQREQKKAKRNETDIP